MAKKKTMKQSGGWGVRKRLLSLVMALSLTLGMLPAAALASDESSALQIGSYYKANQATGAMTNEPVSQESSAASAADNFVTVNKTISGTTVENEFDITLTVSTKEELEELEISPDAAVVVVMDTSTSMQWDLEGGGYATSVNYDGSEHDGCRGRDYIEDADAAHNSGNDVYASGNEMDPGRWLEGSRIEAATQAVNQFIDSYVNNAGSAKRYFSLVNFSATARVAMNWTDLARDGVQDAKSAVSGLCSSGSSGAVLKSGTNIHHAMQLAQELVEKVPQGIESCYVILLTDGDPNRHMEDGKEVKDGDHETPAARVAARILADTTLYAIAYSKDVKSVEWLGKEAEGAAARNFVAYDSSQTGNLNTIFESIATQITNYAKAWTVTDPMGDNMAFLGFYQDTKNAQSSELEKVHTAKQASQSGGTITWNLKNDTTVVSQGTGDSKTYTYTLRYHIRFDSTAASTVTGEHPTNGVTFLKYYTKEEQLKGEEPMPTLYFNYPTVKADVGSFSFTKVDKNNEGAVFGYITGDGTLKNAATFTLAHSGSCPCGAGTYQVQASTVNNQVDFSNIPSGHTYTMTETVPEGYAQSKAQTYTVEVSWGQVTVKDASGQTVYSQHKSMKVENELDPQEQTLRVDKTWLGGEPADSTTVSVKVTGVNKSGDNVFENTLTVEKNGSSWYGTLTVPTVDVSSGQEITYSIEEQTVDGWKQVGKEGSGLSWTLKNARSQQVAYSVEKKWVGPAADRTEVTAKLMNGSTVAGTVTLNSGNGWSASFNPVDTYDNSGSPITYTVVEEINGQIVANNGTFTVNGRGYSASVEQSGTSFTIRNTVAQDNTASAAGTKLWKVGGLTGASATFELYADGQATGEAVTLTQPQTDIQFSNLPRYALPGTEVGEKVTYDSGADGHEIAYTIQETGTDGAPAGDAIVASQSGSTFTNTLTGTTSVTVTKVWEDDGNAEGLRPGSITVRLMNGANEVRNYTLTATGEGGVWTESDLTYTFADLPKYDSEGNLITYTVTEDEVENYGSQIAASASGYTITNTLGDGSTSVTVSKVWVDTRQEHENVTVSILADGVEVQSVTLSEENGWSAVVNDLPLRDGGKTIDYTVKEAEVEGYTSRIAEGSNNTFTVYNVIDQDTRVSLSATKTWVGGDDAFRPELTFTLYADGEPTGRSIKSTDQGYNPESITFDGLDKYAYVTDSNGQVIACGEIQYTIQETMDGGLKDRYASTYEIDGNGVWNFTNTFNAGSTEISGSKNWVDGGKSTHSPVKVGVFELDAAGQAIGTPVATDDNVTSGYSFTGLPAYNADGTAKSYAVYEMDGDVRLADGQTITVDGDNYVVSYQTGSITNTLEQEIVSVPVNKVWQGPAAQSVTFVLCRNGSEIDQLTLTAADAGQDGTWSGSFDNLPKYDSGRAEYRYTVEEAEVEGYTASRAGNTFVNTVEQSSASLTVVKEWNLPADGSVELPASVELQLYADGVPYAQAPAQGETDYTVPVSVSPDGNGVWTYTFENLPKYAYTYDGSGDVTSVSEIVYTAAEVGAVLNGANYVVQIGNDHYEVTCGVDGDGRYVITNDYIRTDVFGYRVIRNYFTITDGVRSTDGAEGQQEPTLGEQYSSVTVDPAAYAQYDGKEYTLKSGMIDGAGVQNFTFTLDRTNHIYIVVLFYERTVTTPPDPGTGGGTTRYTVTVNYYDQDGNTIAPSHSERHDRNYSYDVTAYDAIDIEGYTYDRTTGDPLTGTLNGNKEINVYYNVNETDLEEPDVPQGELPDDPGTDLEDPDVPQGELPDDPGAELPDEDVPMGEAPATGDSLMAWVAAAAVSGVGLVWLAIAGKKRRDGTEG